MPGEFTLRIIAAIKSVRPGRVASYGEIAAAAGNPRGARQVVRVLNTYSLKEGLPWHRIVRKGGTIALPRGGGFERQKALLEAEGFTIDAAGRIANRPGAGSVQLRNRRAPAAKRQRREAP